MSLKGGSGEVQVGQPIRLFMLKASDIKDANFLKNAVPVAWRYLVFGQGLVAIADVKETGGSVAPSFGNLIRGPIAERLSQATQIAEQKYGGDLSTYEVRVLEIPSFYITALWLHGGGDVFFPFLEGAKSNAAEIHEDPTFEARVLEIATAKGRMRPTPERSL